MSPFTGPWGTPIRYHQQGFDNDSSGPYLLGDRFSVSGRLSWPGQVLTPRPRRFNLQRFIQKEWVSVFFWVLAVLSLAIVVDSLVAQSRMRNVWSAENDMRLGLAILSDWILSLFPSKIKGHLAPGFLFANGVILLSIHHLSGSCPSLICRICEWSMGRLQLRGLISAIVIHTIGGAALVLALDQILPESTVGPMLGLRLQNSDVKQPLFCTCIRDFVKELLVSMLFPVLYFVTPTLLSLNRSPAWIFVFLLYPLYLTAIDGDERASTLSPVVTAVTCLYLERGWWRIAAQCFGGFLGGRIMLTYFPDDPKV